MSSEVIKIAIPYVRRYGYLPLIILGGAVMMLYFLVTMFSSTIISMFEVDGGFVSGRPTPLAVADIGSEELLHLFQRTQEETNVSWAVLAAICKRESSFGKDLRVSETGAVGIMQFEPTTWSGGKNPYARDDPKNPLWDTDPKRIESYGGYGTDRDGDGIADPYNAEDAIYSAAKLLKANGFEKNPRDALWHYNHDSGYVNEILEQAEAYSASMIPATPVTVDPAQMIDGWPLPAQYNQISSPYGMRVLDGVKGFHDGIDIPCPTGTPLFAVLPGKVIVADWTGKGGYTVVLAHENNTQTIYCHLSKFAVIEGQRVQAGTVLGLAGNTGHSHGSHLHFKLQINGRIEDPQGWLKVPTKNY